MLQKKIMLVFVMLFATLGMSSPSFAKEAKKSATELLKEVDTEIQTTLNAIPSGNAQEVSELLKVVHETAAQLSANYKFEFERNKAMAKLKKARDAAKKSDLATTDQELKDARESFANLKNFL